VRRPPCYFTADNSNWLVEIAFLKDLFSVYTIEMTCIYFRSTIEMTCFFYFRSAIEMTCFILFSVCHRDDLFFLERRQVGALGVLHGLARDQGFWEVDQGGLGERHPRGPGRGATCVIEGRER
jgi:hypothetical protein